MAIAQFGGPASNGTNGTNGTNNTFGNASANQTIEAKALDDHECDDFQWHFVITQIGNETQAPDSINVTWEASEDNETFSSGNFSSNNTSGNTTVGDNSSEEEGLEVQLAQFTGKTAHYNTSMNLDRNVTSANATIYADWDGQFNLSSGPCFGEDGFDENETDDNESLLNDTGGNLTDENDSFFEDDNDTLGNDTDTNETGFGGDGFDANNSTAPAPLPWWLGLVALVGAAIALTRGKR